VKIIFNIFFSFSFLFALSSFAQTKPFIQEIMPDNKSILLDDDYYQFTDWIEINCKNTADDLFVTDNLDNKPYTKLPKDLVSASSNLVIITDGKDTLGKQIHASFKLNRKGETVYLLDRDFNIIDSYTFPAVPAYCSVGKSKADETKIEVYEKTTPGEINNQGKYSLTPAQKPSITPPSGWHTDKVDYSAYPESTTKYEELISSDFFTVIKSQNSPSDSLASEAVYSSFIYGKKHSLPLVSIIVDNDYFYGDKWGMYNDKDIAKRKEWERYAHLQYFENYSLIAENDCKLRLFGSTAYELPQKSLSVFLEDKPAISYSGNSKGISESFVLRSSSDDWAQTLFRDAFVQLIVGKNTKLDLQAYKPTVLYINGEYYGIHNIRDKINEDYLFAFNNIDKDSQHMLSLNFWSGTYEVKSGSSLWYNQLIESISNQDADSTILKYIDLKNFANYSSAQIYTGNRSWKHNTKLWYADNAPQIRWLLYDLDRAYARLEENTLAQFCDEFHIYSALIKSDQFKSYLIQNLLLNTQVTFNKQTATELIDSIYNTLKYEMPQHISRWKDSGGIQSMESWESEVNFLKEFAEKRLDTIFNQVQTQFDGIEFTNIAIEKSPVHGGNIELSGVAFPFSKIDCKLASDLPVQLKANAKKGYRFAGWEGISKEEEITVIPSEINKIKAVFEPLCELPDTITSEIVLVEECSPYYIDKTIVIEQDGILQINKNTRLLFGDNISIENHGKLYINGKEGEEVILDAQEGVYWKEIKNENAVFESNYMILKNARSALQTGNSTLHINNSHLYESDCNCHDFCNFYRSDIIIENSSFYGYENGDKRDCIDGKQLHSALVRNNRIVDVSDDAIDIGMYSENVEVYNNWLSNIKSVGISIGEETHAVLKRNTVSHSNIGVQVHTQANAKLINQTLANNDIAMQLYHYASEPESGGEAFVYNTIFSQNSMNFDMLPNSSVYIQNSLSDTDILEGENNLSADPQFIDRNGLNFHIQISSVCIDAGTAQFGFDPDNSLPDLGALWHSKDSLPEYSKIKAFPSVFRSSLFIETNQAVQLNKVFIYSMSGQIIRSYSNITDHKLHLHLDNLSAGSYIILAKLSNGSTAYTRASKFR